VESLAQKVIAAQARGEDPARLSAPGMAKVDGSGAIQIYVETTIEPPEALASLKAAGLRVELANAKARLVQGWLPAAQVNTLVSMAEVRRVSLPAYAHHRAGSVTTQGDTLLKSNLVRALAPPGPYTGSGVKVCVISD